MFQTYYIFKALFWFLKFISCLDVSALVVNWTEQKKTNTCVQIQNLTINKVVE